VDRFVEDIKWIVEDASATEASGRVHTCEISICRLLICSPFDVSVQIFFI
jgi:hypothetical protein